jgi:glutamate synthase domain-containing protein 2
LGFKLCVGSRVDVLAMCKAMLAEGITPDFIIVDGAEGGTAAAPLEYEDHVGLPLTDGLMIVHNALVGAGLRDKIRIGASGKVATGNDIVKRLIQGADYTNSARSMMMATGCIQSQRCHTNHCPVGVATQDRYRARALDVADKSERVHRYQRATVAQAMRIMASMGVSDPSMLNPQMLRKRLSPTEQRSYAELYEWLAPDELLNHARATWRSDWESANPDSFAPVGCKDNPR